MPHSFMQRTTFSKASRFCGGIAVQLHIGDVPGVGQRVVGGLQRDLLEGGDGVVHRHMEAVGVVFPVRDARG